MLRSQEEVSVILIHHKVEGESPGNALMMQGMQEKYKRKGIKQFKKEGPGQTNECYSQMILRLENQKSPLIAQPSIQTQYMQKNISLMVKNIFDLFIQVLG